MNEEKKYVVCDKHGKSTYAFICTHLMSGKDLEFVEVKESDEEENPWAWCKECDNVIKNSEAEHKISEQAQWSLLCIQCYNDKKSHNRFVEYVTY